MNGLTLQSRLDAFDLWKKQQVRTIEQLEPWLKQQNLHTKELKHTIQSSLNNLHSDHITVAIVGEFSRGKTELINALFFNDHGKRLLPTEAGRTTMCPTEVFQDDHNPPSLQLLPIETRADGSSLIALQKDPSKWIEYRLDLGNPSDIENKLKHITESICVSIDKAKSLGLSVEADPMYSGSEINIPRWRMARINIRHPLLAQGLKVIDTPGLNAIGTEPELTYEILPGAQAKLFVLGADTGVTRSDLDIWQQFANSGDQPGLLVVLNKTDTLWDELRSEEEIGKTIDSQCEEVAKVLGVDRKKVFATSAQKALLANIRKDSHLKQKTGIAEIEAFLAHDMIDNRQKLLLNQSGQQMDHALEGVENLIASRLIRTEEQKGNLSDLGSESDAAIERLIEKAQRNKQRYQNSVAAYKESRQTFKRYGLGLLQALDTEGLDQIVLKAHKKMAQAWTTRGLKDAIKLLFFEINHRMETSSEKTQAMRRLVRGIYHRFQTDHKFELAQPAMFSISQYQVELGLLHQQSEVFRNSPRMMLTEQHFAVKRYFDTIIRQTRNLFKDANSEATNWLETALEPLAIQVNEHRVALSAQLNDLKEAGHSRKTVQSRINKLEQHSRIYQGQLESLKKVRRTLKSTHLPETSQKTKPRLVTNDK